ncbi:MAG: ferrous iron transporter B [Crocinitomicaceae bacterium]|nr:ferrous iron transporter B [Crocinitomicaceae bacterium]
MKVALLGNPNTGKSSIFNLLTGLRQQVGNFAGVTVEKKQGTLKINDVYHQIIDFPGTYSIYPHSEDEKVVYNVLSNKDNTNYPDVCVVVLDASNLRRNLFFFSQIYDLGLPTVMVLNMIDVADRNNITISIDELKKHFPAAEIVTSNARVKLGKNRIIDAIKKTATNNASKTLFIDSLSLATVDDTEQQEKEAEIRFAKIDELLPSFVQHKPHPTKKETWSNKVDKVLTHPFWGYFIFALILMVIFQFIFSFATVPMDFIEEQFGLFSIWIAQTLPDGLFNDLLSKGIIPGIGGVAVFIPQIAILFFFLTVLEETGYMARVVFIMDKLMRPFGLNGKSVVPLISGAACAIPAVMATRTISDWKERMITIMVTPLISCSARIPVYTLLISLVIPNTTVLGFINLQGLVLFGLYALGVVSALGVAFFLKLIIKAKGKKKSYLLMEIPAYKTPRWGNVGITVFEKVKLFILDAGKIILAISIILWALASYGPGDRMEKAVDHIEQVAQENQVDEDTKSDMIASAELENSYIGIMGKFIEPAIAPLGYDWKMGISLITSFAAREIFVGSLATIYSTHDDGGENIPLKQKLLKEKRADGTPVYTLASGVSLLIFYVFAMQCMATMAVVKRETGSWSWTFYQFLLFDVIAYAGAFLSYHLLS